MSSSVPEGNRNYWHLRSVGLSAVTERLRHEVSQPLVESLLRLGVSEHDENKGVDVLMHYHVVLAVLEMIENEGLETKLYVSHMVREKFILIGRFQPTPRDTNDNREMYDFWWTNKRSE